MYITLRPLPVADPTVTDRAIVVDGEVAGQISLRRVSGHTEVSFWVDRSSWGRGIAGAALAMMLADVPTRPLRARAAADNVASLRLLERAGFRRLGPGSDLSPTGEEEEILLQLD